MKRSETKTVFGSNFFFFELAFAPDISGFYSIFVVFNLWLSSYIIES